LLTAHRFVLHCFCGKFVLTHFGGVFVVGAAGYLAAVYLGWRLVRAIKKSGDINSKQ
jgi:hypothetical protein